MKPVGPKACADEGEECRVKTSLFSHRLTEAQCKSGNSIESEHTRQLWLTPIACRCFSPTYSLGVFTGRTATGHDARFGQELSQRLFASVCDHKTVDRAIKMTSLNCCVEGTRVNKHMHDITFVQESSSEGLLNASLDSKPSANPTRYRGVICVGGSPDACYGCPHKVILSIEGQGSGIAHHLLLGAASTRGSE